MNMICFSNHSLINIGTKSIDFSDNEVHVFKSGCFSLECIPEEVGQIVVWEWVVLNQKCAFLVESLKQEFVGIGHLRMAVGLSSESWWNVPEADVSSHWLVHHGEGFWSLLDLFGQVDGFVKSCFSHFNVSGMAVLLEAEPQF